MNKSIQNALTWADAIAALPIKPIFLSALLACSLALGLSPAYAAEPDKPPVATTVNINDADAETLAAVLVGVGDSRAEDIVRYREQYGPFTTVEQLAEVKGIGASTLDKNRAAIKLD
jgi:competence protein ComEA